jgi:hypothetical protein
MKKLITFLFVSLFIFTFSTGWSQISFEGGINGGATIPTGDYGGTMEEYYSGTKYGLSTGYNIGGYASLSTPIISGRVSLNYASLSNDGSPGVGVGGGTVKNKHNIFTIGIGPQYNIPIPFSPVKPFAVAELLIVSISGETSFQGVSSVPTGTYEIPTATRIGLGIAGGLNFEIEKIGFDLSVKYSILNLAGKEFKSNDNSKRLSSYTNINDGKDPLYGTDANVHIIGNERDMSIIQINLGVHFSLGI